MPLIGMPMLSTMRLDLVRRDDLADRLLRRRRTGWRFPRRACRPGCATCIRIWPASTDGKEVAAEERHQQERRQRRSAMKPIDEHRPASPAPAPAGRGSRRATRSKPRLEAALEPHQRIARAAAARRLRHACACGCSRYFAIVGTSVRDRMNEQTIANITASAIGTNRKRATPVRKNIGTNTMQMQSSETKAGVTIWSAPSRIDGLDVLALLEMPVDVLDRHGGVVDQDADRERQAAERHDVERLAERRQHGDRRPGSRAGSRSR